MIFALLACSSAFFQGLTTPVTPLTQPKPAVVKPKAKPKVRHSRPSIAHKKSGPIDVKPPEQKAPVQEPKDSQPKFLDKPAGSGIPVTTGDLVTVQFVVKKQGGESVADSKKRGLPYSFKLGAPGNDPLLELVVKGMKVGAIRTGSVPAKLAYGTAGAPPAISPKDTLIVTVTLLRRGAQ